MPKVAIRDATAADAPAAAGLLQAYMSEALGRDWHGSIDALSQDLAGDKVQLALAQAPNGLGVIGFAVWWRAYDVHHCAEGGEISDLYVSPRYRGRGVAPALIAHIASRVSSRGGCFVKGRGLPAARSLYRRSAVLCEGLDCYVGGKAFRVLASLASASPRALVERLPKPEENLLA